MKTREILFLLIIGLCMTLMTSFESQAQNTPAKKENTSQADTTAVGEDPLEFSRSVMSYESRGKRDPFESLAPEEDADEVRLKGLFNYEGSTLKGIVSSGDDTYALVNDKDGAAYVLRKGYRVFGGYVTNITDEAVYFHIVKYGRSLSIIMRLASSKLTVIEERDEGESFVQKPGIEIQYRKGDETGEIDSRVTIDDVIVPSLKTRTVEEIWFGSGGRETPRETNDERGEEPSGGNVFVLFDPPSGSLITVPYILDWTSVESENVTYTLIVDDNPDFSSPVLVRNGLTASSCVIGESEQLPVDTDLFWKVTAIGASGTEYICRPIDMKFRVR